MKKLALLLAAMTAVSAVASAKEVVAAPVVAVEPPVLVCPEPVVEWRPTGYVQLTQRYYAEAEHKSIKGNFSRTEAIAQVNLTENDKVWMRSRFYQNYVSPSNALVLDANDKYVSGQAVDKNDRMEVKYFHNFGKIAERVGFESLLNYEQRQSYKRVQAGGTFDFTDYMGWTPEWMKNTFLGLEAKYRYQWDANTEDYYSAFIPAIYTSWNLPLGFTFDANGFMYVNDWNGGYADDEGDGGSIDFTAEFYLNRAWTLYATERASYKFIFTGGLDDAGFYGNDEYDTDLKEFTGKSKAYFEFYMEPHFRVDYSLNKHTNLFATAGAEYRNFEYTGASEAKHWRWRPVVGAGFKTTF